MLMQNLFEVIRNLKKKNSVMYDIIIPCFTVHCIQWSMKQLCMFFKAYIFSSLLLFHIATTDS